MTVDGFFVFVFLILSWCCYLETHTHIQPQLSGLKQESTNVKSQIQLIANPIYFQRCKRQENGLPSPREGTGRRRRTGSNPIQASSSRIERRFFFAFVIQPWWVDWINTKHCWGAFLHIPSLMGGGQNQCASSERTKLQNLRHHSPLAATQPSAFGVKCLGSFQQQ